MRMGQRIDELRAAEWLKRLCSPSTILLFVLGSASSIALLRELIVVTTASSRQLF
jgi:hypothetical protein